MDFKKEYEMTEDRFWELVAEVEWPNMGYYEAKIHYLKTLTEQECKDLRDMAGELWNVVDHFIGDRNPAGGGDDSHSDLCYHIIGLGKEQFYAHMSDYNLLDARGDAPYDSPDGYKESFGYCLPYEEDAENPERAIKEAEETLERRLKLTMKNVPDIIPED
jgi:hypothetical protein